MYLFIFYMNLSYYVPPLESTLYYNIIQKGHIFIINHEMHTSTKLRMHLTSELY